MKVKQGDWVITYSPANRTYLVGKIVSDFDFHPEWMEEGMGIARRVKWNTEEVFRDTLSIASKKIPLVLRSPFSSYPKPLWLNC